MTASLLISILLFSSLSGILPAADASLTVEFLRCEYKVDPLGIDVLRPRFSWRLVSTQPGVRQTAYQIVAETGRTDALRQVWDSGKVASSETFHVVYEGPQLESGRRYQWRVRAWDQNDRASDWSAPGSWEMGLLDPSDWQAEWIAPSEQVNGVQPSPLLRRSFQLEESAQEARLYVTSLGLYEAFINGERVGDEVFTPGWTSYRNRLQYQTYDVTDLLREGENVIGAVLGDGWYRGFLAFDGRRNLYGDRVALLARLELRYAGGRTSTVVTDGTWKWQQGPIQMSEIYMGETYDARLEMPGWNSPGFDDSKWTSVTGLEPPQATLIAPAGPPVRRIEELKPIELITTPAGDKVLDFGQNMVGWVRFNLRSKKGSRVSLTHFEVLDKEGNVYLENLRAADQKVTYMASGKGIEQFEPHFTFQGFRYVKLDGFPKGVRPEDFTGVVIHSDMRRTGQFECSEPLINQLQHNIVWGQKGNFLDVPTDCPQRDERLGWTGDAQAFAPTAAFNMDVASFFTKWLADLSADQKEDGRVPFVVPDVLGGAGSSGWADAATIIPWALYVRYGDSRLLERQYPSMKEWVEYMRSQAGDSHLWRTGFHFGDWLSAVYPGDWSYPAAVTDKDLIATAFYAHSTDLTRRAAMVLGYDKDAADYGILLQKIKAAFQEEFLTDNGRLSPNSQTAYALALRFDLLPLAERDEAARRLVADIRSKENHLSTGFLGTPHLCHVLTETGQLPVAYELLFQDTYPSWLYPVKQGATTIWERWDGIRPDGSFQDAGMNSFNHYAYGAVGEWLYEVVAGIRPDPANPGYRHVIVAPQPGGGLDWVRASLDSISGEIESSWRIEGSRLIVDVTVPPNVTATIHLPDAPAGVADQVRSEVEGRPEVIAVMDAGGQVSIRTGSGRFHFEYER